MRRGALGLLLILALDGTASARDATADFGPGAQSRINADRAARDRGPLAVSVPLSRAAARHARDMALRGYFSHTGADGSTIAERVRREGYGFCFVAENIARGQATLDEVLLSWMSSDGHRRNILHDQAAEFGLARAPGNVWVMVLGRQGC
ncbi:MAG: CAP domain-containing protein [Roseovarius sp.]